MNKYDNINFDYMTEYLIENFPEFKAKKKKFFRKSVVKGFYLFVTYLRIALVQVLSQVCTCICLNFSGA